MKITNVLLISATVLFTLPAISRDKMDKEMRKEKKRLTKEIQEMRKAKIESPTYNPRRSKFKS